MSEEIWKTIPFATNYEASNLGNIKNKRTNRLFKINYDRLKKNNIRARPVIRINDGKMKGFYLNRLIALVFIPNPKNLPEVNHIDGYYYNNTVKNLEWISKKDNMKHANKNNLINRFTKKVQMINQDTMEIEKVFNSIAECSKFLEISYSSLYRHLKKNIPINGKIFKIINNNNYGGSPPISEDIIWKTIKEIPNYMVSNTGLVKHKRLNRILSGYLVNGYKSVCLTYNNKKIYRLIHRLVAQTFLENIENKPCVDHIDTNILNNNLSNLRWVTYVENMNNEITKKHLAGKSILQVDIKTGKIINKFNSNIDCSKNLSIDNRSISQICNFYHKNKQKALRTQKTYKKKWIFIFEDDKDKLDGYLKIARQDLLSKKVYQIDIETGDIIDKYDSISIASKILNLNYTAISQVCNYYKYTDIKRPKYYRAKTHGGYIFKFVN